MDAVCAVSALGDSADCAVVVERSLVVDRSLVVGDGAVCAVVVGERSLVVDRSLVVLGDRSLVPLVNVLEY